MERTQELLESTEIEYEGHGPDDDSQLEKIHPHKDGEETYMKMKDQPTHNGGRPNNNIFISIILY